MSYAEIWHVYVPGFEHLYKMSLLGPVVILNIPTTARNA